jgi:HD-GYP domain-containing protein (c-di-GMP phosphodiesterase class II)
VGSQPATRDFEPAVRLFPVSADSIEVRVLPMDLYLDPGRGSKPILYRAVGVEFTAEDQRRLVEQGVQFLYIPVHQHAAYRRAMLDRLDRLFRDPNRHRSERVRIVRAACAKMIEDVLLFPRRPEAIDAVSDISRQFAAWSSANNREFSYLLDMSAHDYYTVTHMVDVAVGCGLLIRELCPDDTALQATAIQGGMLHDIGKRGVPEQILNKAGRLDSEEWRVIKQHPLMGCEELRANATVPPLVLEMVRDHHERPDGTGYPNGLSDEFLGQVARVCAVVDVFDAICAARPYRGPTPPAETLRVMHEGSGTQFDREILQAWINLVEQMIREDPERAPSAAEAPPQSALSHFMPQAPWPASSSDVPYSERLSWEERNGM